MRSLYALHLSLSVAIPAIQPRLRLSGTNYLRSAFHGGQRLHIRRLFDRGCISISSVGTSASSTNRTVPYTNDLNF
ncbi:MAG: hypothetical protein KZQ63_08030 [Candidatus Thiodiazotropha sp. (ex Lucinoma aequizonata)]|nr:hypothetical protein [Candidatus Thiodiazotropha sp. (ex Lucinoma aequizonata)]